MILAQFDDDVDTVLNTVARQIIFIRNLKFKKPTCTSFTLYAFIRYIQ